MLGADGSSPRADACGSVRYDGDPRVGVSGALFDPQATGLGYPLEQSVDNLRSACFTSTPLESDVDILGPIEAQLHVSLEEGTELDLVAKLCVVDSKGASRLVATGWLNGRHRRGHDKNEPIGAGAISVYPIRLWATGCRVRVGERIRLAVSTSDWPHSFTTPSNPTIAIHVGPDAPSHVVLPTISDRSQIEPVEIRRPDPEVNRSQALIQSSPYWTITEDPVNETVLVAYGSSEDIQLPHGPRYHAQFAGNAFVARHRPDGGRVNVHAVIDTVLNSGEHVRVEASSHVTRTSMLLNGHVLVDGSPRVDRHWSND